MDLLDKENATTYQIKNPWKEADQSCMAMYKCGS